MSDILLERLVHELTAIAPHLVAEVTVELKDTQPRLTLLV